MSTDVLENEDNDRELFIRTLNSYQNPVNSESESEDVIIRNVIEPYTDSDSNSNNTLNICNICFEEQTNFYKISPLSFPIL